MYVTWPHLKALLFGEKWIFICITAISQLTLVKCNLKVWANQLIYANLDDQNVGTIHIKGNYARLFEYCVLLLMWFWFKKFKPIQNKKNDIVDSFVLLSALYSITLGHLVLRPCTVNPFIYHRFINELWLNYKMINYKMIVYKMIWKKCLIEAYVARRQRSNVFLL